MFAVTSLDDPPVALLKRAQRADDEDNSCYFCNFDYPIPERVVIFVAESELLPRDHTATIAVQLSPDLPATRIGSFGAESGAFSTAIALSAADQAEAAKLEAAGRLVKLVVEVGPDKSKVKRPANTPPTKSEGATSRKRQKSISPDTKSGGKPGKGSKAKKGQGGARADTAAAAAAAASEASVGGDGEVPSARWGHSLSLVSSTAALAIGGQGSSALSKDGIWRLDLATRSWTEMDADGALPTRTGHAAVSDVAGGKVYVFGGAKYKRFFTDLHELDLKTNAWGLVKPLGGKAPACSYHSIALFRGEVLIFGGVHPRVDPTPDVCSNELHVFNLGQKNWYQPPLSGTLPAPRSGHSATLVEDELVVFGGWDQPHAIFNDVHVIDLTLMECAKVEVSGEAPAARSWHTAIALPGSDQRRILIHGGLDDDIVALGTAHVLDLDAKRWYNVSKAFTCAPRAGHTVVHDEATHSLVLWGGGDNDQYFDDIVTISLDTIRALCV